LKKFICTRGWKRNPTGDVIEEWEYNKLPDEVKNRNFKEYVPETVKVEPEIVVPEPVKEEPVQPVSVKPVHQRFKTFNVEDTKEE